jgi:sulfite exporter TauE/SafE
MELWAIFLTGLTTGGVACAAMQGGLLASVIAARRQIDEPWHREWRAVGLFLGAKLVAHLLLGFALGLLGSLFVPNLVVRLIFQTIAGLFMVVVALNLLEAHPFFQKFTLHFPKKIGKLIFRSTKVRSWYAPALLGALTIFVPCGVTQAMEVLAINSGSPTQGALIPGTFVLGTTPIFAAIGLATAGV